MPKTSVDIDIDKLNKVREILGTESIRETINAAFREVIRIAAVRDLAALGEAGGSAVRPIKSFFRTGSGSPDRDPRPATPGDAARRPACDDLGCGPML